MNISIRPLNDADVGELVELTLLAFVPVFDSFRELLGPDIYRMIWPDWRRSQREAVETLCERRAETVMLVAEMDGTPVGFVAYEVRPKNHTAEVLLLAVHPDHQNRGIGTQLNERAPYPDLSPGVRCTGA